MNIHGAGIVIGLTWAKLRKAVVQRIIDDNFDARSENDPSKDRAVRVFKHVDVIHLAWIYQQSGLPKLAM